MKAKTCILLMSIILLTFLSKNIYAQKNSELSFYYNYSTNLHEGGERKLPFGIGFSYSKPIIHKLIFNTEFHFSSKNSSNDEYIIGAIQQDIPNRVFQEFYESNYQLKMGLYYPITNKDLLIQFGGNIVPQYSHEKVSIYRYFDSKTEREKIYFDKFSLGVNADIKISYPLSNGVSVFAQPGYTYFFSGQFKQTHDINFEIGLKFKIK